MSYVCVLQSNKQPHNPCHPAEARLLLSQGKAVVYRMYPFAIILRQPSFLDVQLLRVKIDPGSKVTGIAIVDDKTGKVIFAAEIFHRGEHIHLKLISRRATRRFRRQRKTRYRAPRFNNRAREPGWLPPSLESRIANIMTFMRRIISYCPIGAISLELVRFDMQLIQNPEISGIEYQRETLAGYEIREYLLEKYKRTCVYCSVHNVPLEIEHIVPVSRGGISSLTNLALACKPCNQRKDNQTAHEFGFPDVQKQAKLSLKDAAVVNATHLKLYNALLTLGLSLETASGGRTKYNRTQLNLPKAHYIDAACVGESTPPSLNIKNVKPLIITALGHGSRQMCRVDAFGFPRTNAKGAKKSFGYQTGDMIKAKVTKGKKAGTYVGKVAIRTTGSFNIITPKRTVQGISYRYCKLIQACDGYRYNFTPSASSVT